jgi:hypothetical protein
VPTNPFGSPQHFVHAGPPNGAPTSSALPRADDDIPPVVPSGASPHYHVRQPAPLPHCHVRPAAPLPHCHVRPLTPPRRRSPHPCGLPSSRLGSRHSRCMPRIFVMSSSDNILLLRPQHHRHLRCPLLPVRGHDLLAGQLFRPVLLFLRCPKGQSRCLPSSISTD